jgi:polygalacturonase
VEDFGAKADNKTVSSIAVNQALLQLSRSGGGVVHMRGGGPAVRAGPGGVLTYRVARIELQDNVELRIAPHVRLHASPDKGDWTPYTQTPPKHCGDGETTDSSSRGQVFFANQKRYFKIRGGGTVDGGGLRWNQNGHRQHFLIFVSCADAVVEDLTINFPAAWTINPKFSERLIFRRLRIIGDLKGPNHKNTDGFDPYACKDVQILDSYYEAGDDCVAVKSGLDPNTKCTWQSENILVKNLTCAGGHGLTIGSEVSGGIRNVTFSNIDISNSGPSVRIKSVCGRGGTVSDVTYENIKASKVAYAVWFDMAYSSGSPDHCELAGTTQFRNIVVRNLVAKDPTEGGIRINGLKVDGHKDMLPIQGLTLDNVQVSGDNADVFCSHAEVAAHDVKPKIKSKDGTCKIKTTSGGISTVV